MSVCAVCSEAIWPDEIAVQLDDDVAHETCAPEEDDA